MKKILIKFRTIWTEFKIFLGRANSYIVIANAAMLLFLVLDKFKDIMLFPFDLRKYYIPICIISIIFMAVIGWLDTKLGFYREESERASHRNPYFTEIKSHVEKINERLEKIEDSLYKSDKIN